MKFAAELESRIYAPWRGAYLAYDDLKKDLMERQMDHDWCDQDELHFVAVFERELVKVYNFVTQKIQDGIIPRINACEQELAVPGALSTETKRRLANRLADIVVHVNDLARFYQLNQKGFEKMVKKHDSSTQRNLQEYYKQSMQEKYPIDALSQQFDEIIVRISHANNQCDGHPLQAPPLSSREQVEFERATAKYWVHPDNITEVKAIIMFHLPVHVFNSEKKYEANDAAISSVYFDNPEFDLYSERLRREEGAEAIRFRWYGQETKNIYIERKTHHAPWLDGHSVKDRFRLKEHKVDEYIRGTHTPEHIAAELRLAGVDDMSIEQQNFVAQGVQSSIARRRLAPMCRVFYNRTAFQRPADQRLRISLDCNLTFIRENEQHCTGGRHWRRSDVGIEYPFQHVAENDIHRFPYAVLETKIQTHLGQETPLWLDTLLNSHLVHEVPRFSKYLHSAAQLFPNNVPVHPWWFEVLDTDIRKPPVLGVGLSRSLSLQPLVNGHHRHSLFNPTAATAPARDEPKHLTIHLDGVADGRVQDDGHVPSKRQQSGNLLARFYPKLLYKNKKKISEPFLPWPGSSKITEPRGPVRKIEPKTFFANERTFISWLQFCALLLTVALNLLNNGDYISRIIGGVFIAMSSLLCFYALARYQFRAWQLRTGRYVIRYDDLYGPTILCICLVTALCVNFYLRLPAIQETAAEQL